MNCHYGYVDFDVVVSFISEMLIVDAPGWESNPSRLGVS